MRETSFKTRLLGCAAIAAVGWASPVGATASISVGFPDNPPVNITAPPAPTPLSLDQTFSARVGTARVVIQDGPSQMILAGEVQSVVTPVGGATLGESLEDVLHFSNLPGPTPITFNFLVDGTVLVPTPDFNDLVVFGDDLSPAVTMNITANSCGGVPFPRCLLLPVNTPTPVQLDIVDTVTVTNGLPQNIALSMQLSAVEGSTSSTRAWSSTCPPAFPSPRTAASRLSAPRPPPACRNPPPPCCWLPPSDCSRLRCGAYEPLLSGRSRWLPQLARRRPAS